jgi:hypothetical protein
MVGGHDDGDEVRVAAGAGFDLTALAQQAQPREVTGATFSYVDALLTGRMSESELARIREDLLGAAEPAPEPEAAAPDGTGRILDLMRAGDHTRALVEAEALLAADPHNDAAQRLADACRGRLADRYQAHVGAGQDVPRLAVAADALGAQGLDRWAAYLLSRLDGRSSIDALVESCGYSRLDTLRLLYELLQRGIIAIERRPPPTPPSHAESTVLARVKLKRRTS